MSFICPICRELLLSGITQTNGKVERIVSTKCGHLYHESCLTIFFEAELGPEKEDNGILARSTCPTCQRVILLSNLIQIYPAEDDIDPLGRLISKINSLTLTREELKRENEFLKMENEALRKLNKTGNGMPEATGIRRGLSLGERVLWFPHEDDLIPKGGIVKWMGHVNKTLLAGIECDNPPEGGGAPEGVQAQEMQDFMFKPNHGKFVPVNELILHSDYYAVPPEKTNKTDGPSTPVLSEIPEIVKKVPNFETAFNSFLAHQEAAAKENQGIEYEVKRMVAEEIIAIPSAISDQLKRATKLRSQLITDQHLIENLKQLSIALFEFEDITAQKILIIQESILSLERSRDDCKKNLLLLQFHTALGHSQKIKSSLQAGFGWLNKLESQFELLKETDDNSTQSSTLTTQNLLEMKIDLEFRHPQMEHLATAYAFFRSPGLKLRRNDQAALKIAIDKFEAMRTRKACLCNALLRNVNDIFQRLDDWCEEIQFAIETQFGSQLIIQLEELDKKENQIQSEVLSLNEVKIALSGDNWIAKEVLVEISLKSESVSRRVATSIQQLQEEVKRFRNKNSLN